MDSHRDIKEKIDFFDESVPLEVKEAFLDQIQPEFYPTLRLVSKNIKAVIDGRKNFAFYFFTAHSSSIYILSPDKMTASHVRMGNQLVCLAKEKMFTGEIENAESLLKKAICRYGSYFAMRLIQALSHLPGKRDYFKIDNELVNLYTEQAETVITEECLHYPYYQETPHCINDVINAQIVFARQIRALTQAVIDVYRMHNGISIANGKEVKLGYQGILGKLEHDDYINGSPSFCLNFTQLDANGLWGFASPKADWYCKTPNHKKFLELESRIDALKIATTPTNNLNK